ncbi:titin isoform X3 [Morus notabilis]|uniref:titin isoform X3 n=1 Tax=Morus notabilis TaxID=981085 RepID=UPI000CED6108|nr:titin isoform X3 [Morus notabilis]
MATQADIPEVILHKKLEVEDTSLTTGQFEKTVNECFLVEVKKYESQLIECPETQECQAESENKQVECSTQVEITNNPVNGNSGTLEGGSFLASPSGPTISSKEAGGQVDELSSSEIETKHLEQGQKFEVAEGTAREDEVIEEKTQKADQVDEKLGQNVEAILNQQDSVDKGSGSTEKEIKDSEKDEREGEKEDGHAELSSKENPRIPEVTLDHKDVQSVVETCPEEENVDNALSTEAALLKKECTEERSFEEIKEEDQCVGLDDDVGDNCFSTKALSREESQNNETGESVKDEVERATVTDELGDQEAGIAEKERHEEVLGPAYSQDADELNRQEKDEASIENELQDKDSSATLIVAKSEEVPSQEKDNPEILKGSSEIGSENIAKESLIEVTKQTEIFEENAQVKGAASGDTNSNENYEQEPEISSRKPDEEIRGKDEGQDVTEAAVDEAKKTEGSSLVAAEDITTDKLIQEEELTEAESTKHENHPDDNLLPQKETEEEKFEEHFNVVSEEIKSVALREDATTVTPINEEGENKSLEESFKESNEITNLPLTDEKAESTEGEVQDNDANNSSDTHLLVEQAEVTDEKIDEVSELESHEKDQTSDEASVREETHGEAESEGYQITEKAFVLSTEEVAPTEIIVKACENTGETEQDCGVSSKESLVAQDAGGNELEKIKKEAEVTDLDVQKFTSTQESEESSALDDIPAKVDNTVGKITEEASKPTGEDESHKQEGTAADFNKGQISERDVAISTSESIQEETSKSSEDNVKDAEKLNEEESPAEIIKEGNINDLSLENIQEYVTETLKHPEREAEKSKEVLEELETVGASETNKDIERTFDGSSVKQEEGQHEEGKYLDRAEASIEESKVVIAEEEALESKGEDEDRTQESTEGNADEEQIIERDVTFSTPELVQEEKSSSQDNIKDSENFYEDESTVESIKEGDLDDLTPENTQKDATKTLEDRENEAENFKEEIVEELASGRACESIRCETNKDVKSFVDASSVNQEEIKDQDQEDPIKSLTEENKVEISEEEALRSKREDESHRQEAESDKEQIIEGDVTFSAAESVQEETISSHHNVNDAVESIVDSIPENNQEDETKKLNDHENEESFKEEVVQETETAAPSESISFETNKDGEKFVDASSIKQEEDQQEGKYQDPSGASIEENKVETPNEETSKSKGDDESHRQESTITDFNKEQIVGEEDTFSTPAAIQQETSKSSQDNIEDAEKINKEHPAEITKEDNINDISLENIQEGAIKVLKDSENEVEKSKQEVVEGLESARPGESIPCETNKDVERSEDASSVKQEEGQQEEGKYLDPTEASIEESKPEDEALKPRGDDESRKQESTGADFHKEEIVEREVTFCTPESIQEETSKASQDDANDEEKITEITKISEINDLSQEDIQEDVIETSKDHENEAEKSKEEFVEELETAGASESIPCEKNKDVESSFDAPSVKQEESQKEEGKSRDPNGAPTEENKVEIFEKEALKPRGEDECHEQIVGEEVAFSAPEPIQEETSKTSQDNIKEAQKINEESTAEITKEGNINDLSQENIQEDVIEVLEDHENEVEKSKKEVVQELETAGPSESIPSETHKDVEGSVDASLVKQEESRHEEGKYRDQIDVSIEENKLEDKFSTELVKNDDDNKVIATEREIELATKGEEDQQQATQKDEPEEKLEDLLHVTLKETDTENLSEMDRELACAEVEKVIQNLNENSKTKKDGEKPKITDDTNDSEKEIPKELETTEAGERLPYEINEDAESSVDALSLKQEESQQEKVKYIDQVKALTEENKLEETGTAEVVKDDQENKVSDASSKDEVDQQHATQKEEYEDKLENLPCVTPEETKAETSTENARSITSMEVEGTAQNLEETSETEKTKDIDNTNDSEKEIPRELETAYVDEEVEHFVESSSINQDEIPQDESKYLDQVEAPTENIVEEIYSTEEVKENDGSKVEVTEKKVEVVSKDEEDQQQASQKDEPREKLEDLLHVTPEESDTEPSNGISREITCVEVEGAVQNVDETAETENEGAKTKNVNVSEKEISNELETTEAGESFPCKINEDAESSFDAPSVKQEKSQQEEVKYIGQVQASIEDNKPEESFTTEVVKVDDENKVSTLESKAEEDQQQAAQQDKPGEKLKSLLPVTPEETETETSTENAQNITFMGVEGIAQNLEETSEKEKTEHVDRTNDSEKEIPRDLETAGTGESNPCKTNEDVEGSVAFSSVKQEDQQGECKELDQIDTSKEENEIEDAFSKVVKEDDDNEVKVTQQSPLQKDEPEEKLEHLLQVTPEETGPETLSGNAADITCVEQDGTIQDVEETSKTENKEENMKNTDDTNALENEIEQIKPENLEDNAKPNEDLCTTITTEAPEEERREKEPAVHDGSDSGSAGILADETNAKEAKPDDKEEVKSYGISLEEKDLKNNQVQSESIAPEELTSIVGSATTEIVTEETCLKEAKPDDEDQTRNSDVAFEEKGVSSSVDVGLESDFASTGILSEEARLKEAEPDDEEQVKSYDVALEEKGLASNVIVEEIASEEIAEIADEETLKEGKADDKEYVQCSDFTPEKEGLVSDADIKVQSASVSTETKSEESCPKEAKRDHEEQLSGLNIVSKEKSPKSSLDATLVSEELKEVITDDKEEVKSHEETSSEEVAPETCDKEAKQDLDLENNCVISPEEKSLASCVDTEIMSEEIAEIVNEQTRLEEGKADDKEHVQSSDFALEKEGLISEADVEVQSASVSTDTTSEETGVKEAKRDHEAQLSGLNIVFGEKGPECGLDTKLVSEETSLKEVKTDDEEWVKDSAPEHESPVTYVDTKVQSDSISARLESEETCLKEEEPKNEEVRSYDIAPEEENSVSEETGVKKADSDNKEDVKNSDIASEEKGVEGNVDSDEQRNENVTPEENEENKQTTKEGLLQEENDSKLESYAEKEIAKEEVQEQRDEEPRMPPEITIKDGIPTEVLDTTSVVQETREEVSREIVDECSKEVEKIEVADVIEETKPESLEDSGMPNEDLCTTIITEAPEEEKIVKGETQEKEPAVHDGSVSRSAGILAEETNVTEAKTDYEEKIKNSDAASEEKGVLRSIDVGLESDSVSTGILSEEARLKEAEPDDEEQVKSCHVATEEKGRERSVDVEVQSDFASRVETDETSSKEAEPESVEVVKRYDIAPEEKGLASNVLIEEQSDPVSTEIASAEGKADNKEHVQSSDFALEKKGLVSDADIEVQSASVSTETASEESRVKAQLSGLNIVWGEKNLEISSDTKTESEETSLKEAESDNKEEVKISDIAPQEKGVASYVVGDLQQSENEKSEENEVDKVPEGTGESEEKIEQEIKGETRIAGTENKEQATKAETSLEDSLEANLQDSSTVSSVKHEPVITEASERSDESITTDKTKCENENLPTTEPTKGELLQEEDVSKSESSTEKEIANEEIEGERDEELSLPPEITTKDVITTEMKKVHDGVENAVENESNKEQVTDRVINLNESHPVSIVDERVYEDKVSGEIVTEVVSKNFSQAKETSTEENEESAPTAPEEEKIYDEGSIKPVDVSIANNETTTVREETSVTNSGEAQSVETDSEERNPVLQESEYDKLPAQKVESVKKLEERSFDLDQADKKETEKETTVEESLNEVEETKLASQTEDVDATGPIRAMEKLETDEVKEENKETSECRGVKAVNEHEITSEHASDDGISKEKEHETETIVEEKEEIVKEVESQDKEKIEASSATHLESPESHEAAEERLGKEGAEEDIKTAPETVLESRYESIEAVSKDEVIADRDLKVGVSIEQVQELETTEVVKKTQEYLVSDKVEETELKEETEEEITEAPITVSRSDETRAETKDASETVSEFDSRSVGLVTEDKKISSETFLGTASEVQLLDQSYVLLSEEQEDEITTAAKEREEKTTEETSSEKEVLGADKIRDITEASETVSKENCPGNEVVDKDSWGVKPVEEVYLDKEDSGGAVREVLNEVSKEECGTFGEVSKIEPQESEGDTRVADSPSDYDKDLEARGAVTEASNLNVEKREIASDFVSEKVESPEGLTSIEEVEIIENHLKVATTDLRTEEPQCETTIEKTTEKEISDKEELSTEISREKDGLDVKEVHEIIQEIKQPEESSHATCKELTPTEAQDKDGLETRITTNDNDSPPKLTSPVEETSQRAEHKDTQPGNDTSVNREIFVTEIKKEEGQGENVMGGGKTETKPAVVSLSDIMQSLKEETVEHAGEEREEPTKNGREAEKTKTDEEEEEEEEDEHEHEHEEADHPDAPILVQTSKDIDTKVGRKKSHGLFSGVGSKVKHSISKVKKVIIGKSSHSKTLPSG